MEYEPSSKIITIFLNGKITRKCKIQVQKTFSIADIISNCKEKLKISMHSKCKLLDSRGEELSDDDMEYINSEEPLFISQGEDFIKSSSMAIYKELKKLGQGGFGSVYLYKNKLINQEVAIKFIELRNILSIDDVQRMYSEISILRELRHQNIVDLIDIIELDNKTGFVMEYCSGGELKEYLNEKGPLSESEVYRILLQIVHAIRYCHNSLIVHRDLKLENILFKDRSRKVVKIVDFGISGVFTQGKEGQRSDAGSLHYIAPEVLTRADNRANPALDVWSLGCVIYAMLTKKLPFTAGTRREVGVKIINCNYEPLPKTISKPWHKLIKGILRKDPSTRWNMIKISEHLDRYQDTENLEVSDDSFETKTKVLAAKSNGFIKIKSNRNRTPDTRNPRISIGVGVKKNTPSFYQRSSSNTPPQAAFLFKRPKSFISRIPKVK
jgi:serine/threonine protein kinase